PLSPPPPRSTLFPYTTLFRSNPEPPEFKEISKEVIQKTVEQIDAKLSGNEKASSKAKAKLRYIKKNFESNLKKYEEQEAILGERDRKSTRLNSSHVKISYAVF